MPIITLTNGRQFPSNDAESLLDAALRADVSLAHSCKTGRCSSCKSQVRSGQTVPLHDEIGLSLEERASGWILSCARAAQTDITLDADDLGGLQLPPKRMVPCRIHAVDRLSADVLKVLLRLPPTANFAYLPGQYVDVIAPGGVRRSYSIANAPAADQLLELHIRSVEGGVMSRYWFEQAKPHDLLRLDGPQGSFCVRDTEGLDLVFLATGTGMAPVKAMLESLSSSGENCRPQSVSVFWGGRVAADLYWQPHAADSKLRYVPVLSRASAEWPGMRGHVQQAMLAQTWDFTRTVVYACGSDAMIRDAQQMLVYAGLPERSFHSDAFVCSAAA